ncbi:MAG: FAD-dependent oxidoreductase, partial [Acidobacteriota bacterium]
SIRITRLSEPKNYSLDGRAGRTLLCAELPCHATDDVWRMTDNDLGSLVREDLARAGIPITSPVSHIEVKRLAQAYPIYERGFRPHFDRLNNWLDAVPRAVSLGRQGLFAHDNTHHTLAMAYAATDCIGDDGSFDRSRWARARKEFESFVVED